MPDHQKEEHRIFAIECDRPLVMGESFLIATAYNTFGAYWFGEQFLLTELPKQALDIAKFRVTPARAAPDLSMVDTAFVFDGVLGLARSALAKRLMQVFEKSGGWDVFNIKFDFKPVGIKALASCWVRQLYHDELAQIADRTESPTLATELYKLRSLPVFQPK